jgi:hypothetical protein
MQFPKDILTAASCAIEVHGHVFDSAADVLAALSYDDPYSRASPAEHFVVSATPAGSALLSLRSSAQSVRSIPFALLLTVPAVAELTVSEVSHRDTVLRVFTNALADSTVSLRGPDADALSVANEFEMTWQLDIQTPAASYDLVFLAFPLAVPVLALDAACADSRTSVTLFASDAAATVLVIEGPAAAQSCELRVKMATEVSQPAQELSFVLLSADNVNYFPVATVRSSGFPAFYVGSQFVLLPVDNVYIGSPTMWTFNYYGMHFAVGDAADFTFSLPLAADAPTIACRATGDPDVAVFTCKHSNSARLACVCAADTDQYPSCYIEFAASSPAVATLSAAATVTRAGALTTVGMPGLADVRYPVPAVEADAALLNTKLNVSVTVHAAALNIDDVITLRVARLGRPADFTLELPAPACVVPGAEPFCAAIVIPDQDYVDVQLTITAEPPSEPVTADVVALAVPLPLLVASALEGPLTLTVLRDDVETTFPTPFALAHGALSRVFYSGAQDGAEHAYLLLEAAQELPAGTAIAIGGVTLSDKATVAYRNCGLQDLSGEAAVERGADGDTITLQDAALSLAAGSLCTVVLPADHAVAEWVTVDALGLDTAAYTTALPIQPVIVDAPPAIAVWAPYRLDFAFSVFSAAPQDDVVFSFDSNIDPVSKAVNCTAAGAHLPAVAVVTASGDADFPFAFTVGSHSLRTVGPGFVRVECQLTLQLAAAAPDLDYQLARLAITRVPTSEPPLPLGRLLLVPRPAITLRVLDGLRSDLVIEQVAVESKIHLYRPDGNAAFTYIRCDGAEVVTIADEVVFLLANPIQLSLRPVALRCFILYAADAPGTPIKFHPTVAETTLPDLPRPSPTFHVDADRDTIKFDVNSTDPRPLSIHLRVRADHRRVDGGSCDCAQVEYKLEQDAKGETYYTMAVRPSPLVSGTSCLFLARFVYAPFGSATVLGVSFELGDGTAEFVEVAVPRLQGVQANVASVAVTTAADLTLQSELHIDTEAYKDMSVTNIWGLQNTEDDPFFLPDGSSMYIKDGDKENLAFTPNNTNAGVAKVSIHPSIGAFAQAPSGDALTLRLSEVTYPGTLAPPRFAPALVIRQTPPAALAGVFTVEMTFATPTVAEPALAFVLDIAGVSVVEPVACRSEGTPVPASVLDGVVTAAVSAEWASKPLSRGSLPLELPHVTVACQMRITNDPTIVVKDAMRFTAAVTADGVVLAEAAATMAPPALISPSISFTLKLQYGRLIQSDALAAVLYAVATVVLAAGDDAVVAREQVSLVRQTPNIDDTLSMEFLVVSRGNERLSFDPQTVSDELVAAVAGCGYEATMENTGFLGAVDALAGYRCGGGLSVCVDGAACAWDSDCASRLCTEGVCSQPDPDNIDPLWIWLAGSVAGVAVIALVSVWLYYRCNRCRRVYKPDTQNEYINMENADP